MTSDILDRASENEERFRAEAIKNAIQQCKTEKPNGYCHNCQEPLDTKAFCDTDCKTDWEKLNNNR